MNSEAEKREYIKTKVNPILERLVVDLLINRPDDVVSIFQFCNITRFFLSARIYERMDRC